jgi:hypothetical protein
MPQLIEELEKECPGAKNPEAFAAAVNSILLRAVQEYNFDHFIFNGIGASDREIPGITVCYASKVSLFDIDALPFDLVVFHDPLAFMGQGKIAVIRGLIKPQRTVVAADVGMCENYGSGRAAVVFEEGKVLMASPSAAALAKAEQLQEASLSPEAIRLAAAMVFEAQGSHDEAVKILTGEIETKALEPQTAQAYLDARKEYDAAKDPSTTRFLRARRALMDALQHHPDNALYFGRGGSAMNQLKFEGNQQILLDLAGRKKPPEAEIAPQENILRDNLLGIAHDKARELLSRHQDGDRVIAATKDGRLKEGTLRKVDGDWIVDVGGEIRDVNLAEFLLLNHYLSSHN